MASTESAKAAGKIALEEHFSPAGFPAEVPGYVNPEAMTEIRRRLTDLADTRLAEMDAAGIGVSVLSLVAPGVQAETDPGAAARQARQVNDEIATVVARHPSRYVAFGTVALHDPAQGAAELDRCVTQLGFRGVMLNGYTSIDAASQGWYYDDPRFYPFWERVEQLEVPVYLHPRDPLPANQGIYAGHPELFGAVWTFTVETATHALRLITSGLFDRYPGLSVILGHLGETLPFARWRIEHRLGYMGHLSQLEKSFSSYLRENFYVTTSGFFHDPALASTMTELGSDRILFATDYPFESMTEASDWFDRAPLGPRERAAIGHDNAARLLGLGT